MLPYYRKYFDHSNKEPVFNPYRVLSYYKQNNYTRDCISLFFEYIGENSVKIHKYYYGSDSFISFLNDFTNESKVINYRNINTYSYDVSYWQLVETIKYLSRALRNDYPSKSLELSEVANRLSDEIEEIQTEEAEACVDKINEILLGYQRHLGNPNPRHYFNDELKEALERNIIVSVPAVDNLENVKIPACMPEEYRLIDDHNLFELRVYSVGQANCSALIKYTDNQKVDYKVVVVFDFGLEHGKKNPQLKQMIDKIDENTTIIISHFDSDHINNIGKFDLNTTCRWLFPEHEPTKKRANLLYHNLIKAASRKSHDGKKAFTYEAPYSLSNYLRINQNTGAMGDRRYQSTLENAQCIIASLCINDKNVLIPADALYKDFPTDVFNYQYDYVLIPHHGCEYGDRAVSTDDYFDNIKAIVREDIKGVVMCGEGGRRYGHANTNHLKWYSDISVFDDASFFSSKDVEDTAYSPNNVVFTDYYSIKF